jgi:hypothetical protein
MEPTDVTVEILKDIRGEMRGMRSELAQTREELSARIDATNERLDVTNERLGHVREELARRIVDSEIRTSTAITDLAGAVNQMTLVLRTQHDLRPRVEKCERDIIDLRRQLTER